MGRGQEISSCRVGIGVERDHGKKACGGQLRARPAQLKPYPSAPNFRPREAASQRHTTRHKKHAPADRLCGYPLGFGKEHHCLAGIMPQC